MLFYFININKFNIVFYFYTENNIINLHIKMKFTFINKILQKNNFVSR